MTQNVKLSYPEKGIEIDFSDNDIVVEHLYNNPVIIIPMPVSATPVGATAFATQIIGANTNGINIGFVANRFILNFKLTDGIGTLDFSGNGTTKYEQTVYITNNSSTINPKVLTINDADIYVHVESFHFTLKAGDKDFLQNCTVSCIAVKDIKML